MKFGLAARDLRVLALLMVLGLTATVLVVTSWPARDELQRVEDSDSAPTAATTSPPVRRIPAAGRRAASRWAEAYFTSTGRDSADDRRRRLEPYSSDALMAEMTLDSGALGLRGEGASEAEVVALQEQDATPGQALVAIVERTTTKGEIKSTELVTVTVELSEQHGTWVVGEVLVP
ncbi:MAG: hypothetical protein ACRDJL_02990 [Actinomycetota bacterium]